MLKEKPIVKHFDDKSSIWEHTYEKFTAKVYVPETKLPASIINFGYSAPYLLYFEETPLNQEEAKKLADSTGLSELASRFATSIVFITPANGDWDSANDELFLELIANSKIHQYHESGYAILFNRFSNQCDGYAVRGAIYRTILMGTGKSADYIAKNLVKKLTGDGLWGPADVAPTVCILKNLSSTPEFNRDDMPIVSINNSQEVESVLNQHTKHFYKSPDEQYSEIYSKFAGHFNRWGWDGELQINPDFEKLGMIEEPCVTELNVSSDNDGDDKGKKTHEVGYIAYYNKNLFDGQRGQGQTPLLLCFHGGGDSAKHIAQVSEWYKVAHDHNFLLICVENHLNSTATEMMELLEILKKKYPIDERRIYASGFSMGGCKTWDLYQEYPEVFAGLAPMDATFEVGLNVYGKPAPCKINQNKAVPIFYVGGETTPLPELPFQAEKCWDRTRYVFQVNNLKAKYDVKFENQDSWENKIWGINGDRVEVIHDESRNSDLTIHYFASQDGNYYTAFASVSGQGHECRYHSCEQAWQFISQFQRTPEGTIKFYK